MFNFNFQNIRMFPSMEATLQNVNIALYNDFKNRGNGIGAFLRKLEDQPLLVRKGYEIIARGQYCR